MLAWIIENTVMASGLALLVGLVCRFNRTRPAFCHLMWLLVFVVLVIPPIPLGPLGAGLNLRQGISDWIEPEVLIEEPEAAQPGLKALVEEASLDMVELDTEEEAQPLVGTVAPRRNGGGGLGKWLASIPLLTWAILAWALGAIMMAGRLQYRILAFHRNVQSAPSAPRSLRSAVRRVAQRLGIRAPEVRLISGVGCPSVWCFGRPRLLWPRGREEHLDSGCEPSLIAHELAHLVRRDHWVSRLEVLAMGLLWWNPLFWVIRAQVHYYAELSCDAWALWAYPTDRRAYAEALIDAQEKTVVAPVALHGLCATDTEFKDFERRLSMIMKKQVSRGVSKGTAALAILATLLVLPAFADDEKKVKVGECKGDVAKTECFEGLLTAKKLYGEAEKLFQAKDYKGALKLYDQVIDLEPGNGMAHSRMGFMLVSLGEYGPATKHFEMELELGHNPATASYNLACAASMSGDKKKALGYLHKAVARGFDNTSLMAKDTDLDSIRGTKPFEEALMLAEKGAKLSKKMDIAKKSGDQDAVLDVLGQLTEVYSEDGTLHHNFGLLLLSEGYLEDAAQAFERQAETGYLRANAYYNVACAKAQYGDNDGALKSLKHSAKLGMSYAGILDDKDLKSLHGDPRFDELKKVIAAPALRSKKIEKALKGGDIAAARKGLVQVLESPNSTKKEIAWASYELAMIQMKGKDYEGSIANFEKAARIGYSVENAAFHIGVANAALGNEKIAVMRLEQSLDLGFADPELMTKVAKSWSLVEKDEMAQMIERAAKNSKIKKVDKKEKQKELELKKKKKVGATVMK